MRGCVCVSVFVSPYTCTRWCDCIGALRHYVNSYFPQDSLLLSGGTVAGSFTRATPGRTPRVAEVVADRAEVAELRARLAVAHEAQRQAEEALADADARARTAERTADHEHASRDQVHLHPHALLIVWMGGRVSTCLFVVPAVLCMF